MGGSLGAEGRGGRDWRNPDGDNQVQEEGAWGRKLKGAKMASEEGLVWGKYREDPGVAKGSFMTEGEERQPGVASQSKFLYSTVAWSGACEKF